MKKFGYIETFIMEAMDFSGTYDGWVKDSGTEIATVTAPTWQGVWDLLGEALKDYLEDQSSK